MARPDHALEGISHLERSSAGRGSKGQTQTVDVRARIDLPAQSQLFRRCITKLSGERRPDDGFLPQVADLGQAEIDQSGPGHFATAQEDVVGRDIPVDDAFGMGDSESGGDAVAQT